ncbi:hypothetical protein QN239_31270 [Mycolicibacterium sp. Y3]
MAILAILLTEGSGIKPGTVQYVCQTAQDLGYTTETERPLNSGLVADVWVDDAVACQRVEVQRVRTDIPDRTDPHPDVVWLILEYARSNKAMNRYLFTNPCVRVKILDSERNPVQPWADPCATRNPLRSRARDLMADRAARIGRRHRRRSHNRH